MQHKATLDDDNLLKSMIVYGGAPYGMEFYAENVLHSGRGKGQENSSFGAKFSP